MNYQDQLFEAIEIIAKKQLEKQSFSKIIKGNIISEEPNEDGSYNILYLDATIKAYPQNISLKYSKGETVFILLPNGQLNERKTIMGTTANRPDNAPSIDITEEDIKDILDTVVATGRNYITAPKETINLNKDLRTYPITIDPLFLKHYVRSQSHMRLRCRVESNFDRFNLPENFSYGAKIKIVYSNNTEKVFDFSYLNMRGNVYNLNNYVQDIVFEIPTSLTPIEATGELYLTGSNVGANNYVKFSELSLELLSDVLTDIITNRRYTVSLISDSGTVFDEEATNNVKLICQVISEDGIEVDPFGLSFKYEWYSITFDNDGNKIKPAIPIGTDRELIVNLGEQDISIAYYECDVYPNEITKIKKLDI